MASAITFKYLRELQGKERAASTLTKIPDDFYDAVVSYLKRKQRISARDSMRSFTDLKEIENTVPVIKDIFNTRERKIMSSCIRSARTDIKVENMTLEEKNAFDSVRDLLKKRRKFLGGLFETGDERNKNEAPKEPVDKKEDKMCEKQKDTPFKKIEVIEDIPEFVAEDLETYGPWSPGEIVVAPKKVAQIFIDAGKAKNAE
ncbi:MAG: DNA replication complex GINS family protein [Candidatus Aenigmarchaeota archaeon]|nr:DNA replication complex GINS family protein [Candidatus Aenigmarchaeota archaeon]